MSYIIDAGIWSSVFAVPTTVVDRHIKLCSPLSLKILLLLLRHAGTPMDIGWLSQRLNLPAPDIADALNYWLCAGIIFESEQASAATETPALPAASPAELNLPAPVIQEKQDADTGQKIITVSSRAKLSRADIAEMAEINPPFAQLLKEAQQVIGQPLTPSDSETLASLFSYYKFEPGVILMLLQYCVSIDKPSMRYLETVAADWVDRGISAYDQVEQELIRLAQNNEQEKKIVQAFHLQGRGLSARERQCIADWFSLGLDDRLIALACEATLDKTGKVSFSYASKILFAWKEKKITSLPAAIENLKSPGKKPETTGVRNAQTSGSSIDKQKLTDLIHGQFTTHND